MKILVIQLRRVGDILLTTPVVSYLRSAFPQATLDFLCEPMGQAILENNPHLSHLHLYNKSQPFEEIKRIRSARYDVIFDFMRNPRSSYICALSQAKATVTYRHWARFFLYTHNIRPPLEPTYVPKSKIQLVQAWLEQEKGAAPPVPSIRPEFYVSDADQRFADQWCADQKLKNVPFVVLVPAHRHLIRQWSPRGFRQVALDLIQKKNVRVYLAWGPSEENLVGHVRQGHEDEIHLLPPTTLGQMGAIFKKAKMVLSNDSGAMHMAVAVGTPTVTVYGPTRPVDWNPSLSETDKNNRQDIPLVAEDVACLGCHLKHCPVGHLCMTHLSPTAVSRACESFL